MSSTNVACCTCLADCSLDRRTVEDIQRKVVMEEGRGLIFRFLRVDDNEMIINAWTIILDGILEVFNVRSASSV